MSTMNKEFLNELTEHYNIEVIEKHLIYCFLQNNKIRFEDSPIISNLFTGFTVEPKIHRSLSILEIDNLKMLENYLELLIPKTDRKINGAFLHSELHC